MLRMKERVTISVEPEALQIARAEVGAGKSPNLSSAIEAALRAQGKAWALQEALRLSELEHGPIGEEAREWADREWKRVLRERRASSSTQED